MDGTTIALIAIGAALAVLLGVAWSGFRFLRTNLKGPPIRARHPLRGDASDDVDRDSV